eukprot:UN03054
MMIGILMVKMEIIGSGNNRSLIQGQTNLTNDPFGLVNSDELYGNDSDNDHNLDDDDSDSDVDMATLFYNSLNNNNNNNNKSNNTSQDEQQQQQYDDTTQNNIILATFLKQCQQNRYDCLLPNLKILNITTCPKITTKHIQHFITVNNTVSMLYNFNNASGNTKDNEGEKEKSNGNNNNNNNNIKSNNNTKKNKKINDESNGDGLIIIGYASPSSTTSITNPTLVTPREFIGSYVIIPPKEQTLAEKIKNSPLPPILVIQQQQALQQQQQQQQQQNSTNNGNNNNNLNNKNKKIIITRPTITIIIITITIKIDK